STGVQDRIRGLATQSTLGQMPTGQAASQIARLGTIRRPEERTPAVGTPGLSPPTMMENVPGVGQPTVGSGLPSTAYRAVPTTLVDGPLTTGQGGGTAGQGSGLPATAPKQDIPFAGRPGGAMGVKAADVKILAALQKKYPELVAIFVAKQSDPNDWYFAQSLDN